MAQKFENTFKVNFKNKEIGTIRAVEDRSGTKSAKDLHTQTDARVLMMSVHVESEIKTMHVNGVMIEGTSFRHANRGAEDVHARVTKIGDKLYQREKNGTKSRIEKREITF